MSEWREIESAPKDGTKVLLGGGTYSYGMYVGENYSDVTIAYWYVDHWRGEDRPMHDEWNTHNPTHWMPLPEPPK
ncbi:DUF551 domain-containing protein [Xanthomonas campestris]|uniref:DUF551 domain-containing protein n=1 Tax=Xanthomonas campestris TaxID=339 RepID=UPI002367FE27|nr:DUF551 domain-containing protein [Xanthomonas campestris]WDI91963.1 DUF551 domain-containing protein [Xanthomonas campestris]